MLCVTSLAIRLSCHSHQEIHEKSAQYEEHNSQQRPLHIAPPVHSYCNHAVVRRGIFCTAPAQFVFVPWTYRMRDGRTIWTSLIDHYDRGVGQVEANRSEWVRLRPYIDPKRFAAVTADLNRQLLEAWWWRDASIAYWQSLSKLPLPPGHSSPAHPLSYYQAVHFDRVPGFLAPRIDRRSLCVAGRGGTSCAL